MASFFKKRNAPDPFKVSRTGKLIRLLVVFAVGGLVAFVADLFGPSSGDKSTGGRVVEYPNLNPSEHVIYEEEDIQQYKRVIVSARTIMPQNGSATVVIYGDPIGGKAQEINQLEAAANSWSQWEQKRSLNKHLTLKIINGPQPGATNVDVFLYLYPQ